jgi:hypothetical protein
MKRELGVRLAYPTVFDGVPRLTVRTVRTVRTVHA